VGTAEFIKSGLGDLGKLISLYNDTLTRVNAMTRNELDQLCKTHWRDIQVREAFEELCSVEDSWNNFLLQIDKHDGDVSTIPGDSTAHNILRLSLVDARSGRKTALQDFFDGNHLVLVLLRHFA
jgi:hypothetical protein